jgi:hypothetical protein
MRATRLATVLAVASISLFVLTGCAGEDAAEETASETAEPSAVPTETAEASPTVEAGPEEPAAPWEAAVTGFRGQALALGDWVVTVVEAEYGEATDDVSVPRGTTRLAVEVDLENRSPSQAAATAQDWTLVDGAGGRYAVLPATSPEKQGERVFDPGDTEDVTVSFAVPGPSEAHVLRFQPAGSAEALEITLN